jgi:hypothetical protein
VLLDVPAQMQKFVGDGAQFDANAGTSVRLLELFDKLRVLHEGETMPDALRLENYCIVEV